jgi:hypothetical protein
MKYSEADRRRRGKRRKKNYFRDFAIAALVVLGLYFIAFHSGIFSVKSITVETDSHHTSAQIEELAGSLKGENIFMVRVSEVAQILEQDPYIRKADVSWDLPDGLIIVLDERRESVLVEYDDGYVIVDYDGVILRLTKERLIMPVIAGLTPIGPVPGLALKAEEAGELKPGLDFIRFVGENDFYIKRLDLGGVVTRAYVFDRLVLEGELRYMEKNIKEIKRIVADLDSKGIERGTISVSSASCSFSPEIRN